MTHAARIAPPQPASEAVFPDPGPRPTMAWLPIEVLVVDPTYQRTADSERSRLNIRRIAEAFCWTKFQPVTVTHRPDGTYAVIDGQHRVAAAALHPMVDSVPCFVVAAPEIRAQARSFVAINRDRVAVNPMQMHHANVAAGDPDALHMQAVCNQAGVKLPRSQTGPKDLKVGYTCSLGAIRAGLCNFGDGPVVAALQCLNAAYHNVGGQLRGTLIAAICRFFAMHKGRAIDLARLQRVIAEREAAEWEAAGTALRAALRQRSAVAIRILITRDYNKQLGPERRLPEEA